MATQLQMTNFCDKGFLSNTTEEEKQTITGLKMYQRLGNYDPSNTIAKSYKNIRHAQIIWKNIRRKNFKKEHFIEAKWYYTYFRDKDITTKKY